MIRITNTLTGKMETFTPLREGEVRLYTCGPTVYDFAHIGNFRTYIWEDILRRFLKSQGFKVTQVMNITDVDDKIIRGAMAKNISIREYAEPFEKAFFEDLDTLGIERAEHYPRATEHIQDMVRLIKQLQSKGVTYESDGSIYFRISAFSGYGKLAKLDPSSLKIGVRIENDEYEKEEARDFALWKTVKPGEPFWDTELGPGRPGWHIECSAMSMKYLGTSFDIHTGGVDNIFPHHENEIAQSEAATGEPFVRYWLHAEHLIVDGEKMSKSKGNFYTLRELLEKGLSPKAIRYLLVASHYKKQLNFTDEAVQHADGALERLKNFHHRLVSERFADGADEELSKTIDDFEQKFWDAMSSDLNTSAALGAVHSTVTAANSAMDRGDFGQGNIVKLTALLTKVNDIFNVFDFEGEEELDADVAELIKQREEARKARNWELSDQLRDQILQKGYVIEDTRDGTRWKKRS
ncbi:cysteine--tRNA ligase [Acidobacteriota bacterium]